VELLLSLQGQGRKQRPSVPALCVVIPLVRGANDEACARNNPLSGVALTAGTSKEENPPVNYGRWGFLSDTIRAGKILVTTQTSRQNRSERVRWTQRSFLLLLPLLILLTPFLVFLNHQAYGLFHWEVVIGIMGIAGIAALCSVGMMFGGFVVQNFILFSLIMFFVNIQYRSIEEFTFGGILIILGMLMLVLKEKIFPIATAIFGVFLLVSMVQFGFSEDAQAVEFGAPASAVKPVPLPRIIHLILDEHIGFEGIPIDIPGGAELKSRLLEFYQHYGFLTFGGAYSHYFYTENSVSNLVNFSSSAKHRQYFKEEGGPIKLLNNQYFEWLSQAGYRLNVLWGHHIDYCSHSPVAIAHCVQIPSNGLQLTQDVQMQTMDRVQLIFSAYLSRSFMYTHAKDYYSRCRDQLLAYGIALPSGSWDQHKVTALPYLHALDRLWNNIIELPTGNALFAHLLIPHAPYLANADCSIETSIDKWKYQSLMFRGDALYGRKDPNTTRSRAENYQQYFNQVHCLYTRLEDLFEQMQISGIWENSVIIIHGDHGSRIMRTYPTIQNEGHLSEVDMLDGFSTLFAVKLPEQKGMYDSKAYPLEYLLQVNVLNYLSNNQEPVQQSSPYVYLKSEDALDVDLRKVPYPIIQ
jgi:hypothetical protein